MNSALMPWLHTSLEGLALDLHRGHLGHAPLLHGPHGIGKSELAGALARLLLCEGTDQGATAACGTCGACQLFASGSHPDYFYVAPTEEGKAIVVDQIRALIDKISLTSARGERRVAVVTPAEAMNLNAANALLKTLEEPPQNVWLILVSHASSKLPATILSRCQKQSIPMPSASEALEWLCQQRPDLGLQEAQQALKLSAGAPCRACALLDAGSIEFAVGVRDALIGIAQGGSVAPDLATQWAEHSYEAWRWLAHWTSELALAELDPEVDSEMKRLIETVGPTDWSVLWATALDGMALAQTGIRQDLLLGRWLLSWEQQFISR